MYNTHMHACFQPLSESYSLGCNSVWGEQKSCNPCDVQPLLHALCVALQPPGPP